MNKILTRDEFRNKCWERDLYKCVICHEKSTEVHHILERKLFDNGGYYIDNGASLCNKCHILAEQTIITCSELRSICKIKNIIIPSHFDPKENYDKWGNIILANGTRLKGELFFDESVQKILQQGNVLNLFIKYIKYPKTPHLPWSPGLNNNDKKLKDTSDFNNQKVVVTVKMDGENCSLYKDRIHCRSIEQIQGCEWRSWVKNIWSNISQDIPENFRICGENLQAKHSIKYKNLESYFLAFSVWNDTTCLSWDETLDYLSLLNLKHVPILYEGIYNEKIIKDLYSSKFQENECEGYVIRLKDKFHYKDFHKSCAKYVRQNHLQTTDNWKNSIKEYNEMSCMQK